MSKVGAAGGALVAFMLAGCAGQGFPLGDKTLETAIAGRWILAVPGAPTCGMNFTGAPGARTGNVLPEGGCPGNFYMSRRWTLEQDALVINDDEDNPLARLPSAGGRFEGQSIAGLSVTLSRQPALAAPGN